jgi:hypothetical protein
MSPTALCGKMRLSNDAVLPQSTEKKPLEKIKLVVYNTYRVTFLDLSGRKRGFLSGRKNLLF